MSTRALCFKFLATVIMLSSLTKTQGGQAPQILPEQLEKLKQNKYTYTSPDLTDEESEGRHLPDHFKCDACMAVTLMIDESLTAAHKKNPHMKKLTESEMYEAFEAACDSKSYRAFGIKEVDGRKVLTGPGMPDADRPGIMVSGGTTESRLQRLCNTYVEQFEEETIYQEWLKDRGLDFLDKFLCYNEKYKLITDYCINNELRKQKKDEL